MLEWKTISRDELLWIVKNHFNRTDGIQRMRCRDDQGNVTMTVPEIEVAFIVQEEESSVPDGD